MERRGRCSGLLSRAVSSPAGSFPTCDRMRLFPRDFRRVDGGAAACPGRTWDRPDPGVSCGKDRRSAARGRSECRDGTAGRRRSRRPDPARQDRRGPAPTGRGARRFTPRSRRSQRPAAPTWGPCMRRCPMGWGAPPTRCAPRMPPRASVGPAAGPARRGRPSGPRPCSLWWCGGARPVVLLSGRDPVAAVDGQ